MAIKVAQLRTFATVSRCGNIKDAAERLGRTPSAVSMALKQLEEELGGRHQPGQPQPPRIQAAARAVAKMQAFAGNRIGRLELACVPSVAVRILPDVIRDFVSGRPQVQLEVWDMDSLSVRRAVERGEVDLGIASLGRAVCAADSPLTRLKRTVRWSNLGDTTVIANGLSLSIADPVYRDLERQSRLMVRNVTSLLALVRQGVGVTLLPSLSVPRDDKLIHFLPLAVSGIRRNVGVISRADTTLSPVARAFCEVLLRHAPEDSA